MTKSYKDRFPLDHRISESNRILTKYPSHIPVIIDVDEKFGTIKKNKFLVPSDVSASHLMISIRSQIKCKKEEALFMFNDSKLLCPTTMVGDLYQDYITKQKANGNLDKFFYLKIHGENTFGNC